MDETSNGIKYDWGLASAEGAWFTLYPEPHHTENDVKAAKAQLRRERDVVSIKVDRRPRKAAG